MIMFWAYTIGPMVTGHSNSAYVSALVALAAFEIAYFAEIVRAGLQSVPIGQRDAALASGLDSRQAMLLVLLPQALRRMLPSLLTQGLIAFQDFTIASVISVPDVMQMTNVINAREQDPVLLLRDAGGVVFRHLLRAEPDHPAAGEPHPPADGAGIGRRDLHGLSVDSPAFRGNDGVARDDGKGNDGSGKTAGDGSAFGAVGFRPIVELDFILPGRIVAVTHYGGSQATIGRNCHPRPAKKARTSVWGAWLYNVGGENGTGR